MTNEKLINILKNHSITCRRDGNRLLALDVWTKDGHTYSEWTDVTNWSLRAIKNWLGY